MTRKTRKIESFREEDEDDLPSVSEKLWWDVAADPLKQHMKNTGVQRFEELRRWALITKLRPKHIKVDINTYISELLCWIERGGNLNRERCDDGRLYYSLKIENEE